jgi:YidC/Oxa1 family membrane protein insertase
LLQLPLIATVYRLVVVPSVAGHPNLVLAAQLFGAPLAAHWPELVATGGLLGPASAAMLGLVVALLLVATLSARQLPAQGPRILRLLPYGTVVVAAISPVAVGLYLLVSTAWSVAERAVLMRGFAV